ARRDRQPHAETALCVACHPSHFSTRGELTAYRNGYPIRQREALRFVAERLYNNPRPFYGPSGASWVRVIGAAATVQSRMAQMLSDYETVTGEHRPAFYTPIAAYLKKYYNRPAFAPDETEQNPPSISSCETGWMAWRTFDDLARATQSAAWSRERDKVAQLMARDPEPARGPRPAANAPASAGTEIKNVDDLCFQTIALADLTPRPPSLMRFAGKGVTIAQAPASLPTRTNEQEKGNAANPRLPLPSELASGSGKGAGRVRSNADKIFAAQRPDGLWPYSYGDNQPTCEFETGTALYALAKA